MPSKDVTSKRVGSISSKVLRTSTNANAKSAAGSALVQRPTKRGK
jgi:hypothetical protein